MVSLSFDKIPMLDRLSEEEQLEVRESHPKERLKVLSEYSGQPLEELMGMVSRESRMEIDANPEFDSEKVREMPSRFVHAYHCLPLKNEAGEDLFGTVWPPDSLMDDWMFATTGKHVSWKLVHPELVNRFVTEFFGVGSESFEDEEEDLEETALEVDDEDQDAAIIRFVNEIIHQAVEDKATDIHIEPQAEELRIRYRVDGGLVSIPVPDNLRRYQDAVISRMKIMSKLNISERRRPQDGRINYKSADSEIDIRLSTVPTLYGESVSLRLLNKKSKPLSFVQLGLPEEDRGTIDEVLALPHGIVLVTGPTGAGKSTSLNAFIREVNSSDKRVITIEDPVEYEVEGVNQIQVNNEIDFGFAQALRHVLRQDPDIIMVGEMRDAETAEIGIQASLTGHLVFSTLHTNDAPGALTRLIDMGIEPFLIASAIEMVIAQRLVRRLCRQCSETVPFPEEEMLETMKALRLDPSKGRGVTTIQRPVGCSQCRNTGYSGRVGLYEILRVDDHLHDLIVERASSREVRKKALQYGMRPLEESGWNLVKQGVSSLEEIYRVIEMDSSTDDVETLPADG
ncbi:type II/IV secretion system protein [Opitutia bacterium ISCC 51]|nr:type II/IV secretion system protein [Opitutae bacterium ISCC 51]QXD27791.1 type II/IV secretion system protein [Opitutae bacterium ISCC 52]